MIKYVAKAAFALMILTRASGLFAQVNWQKDAVLNNGLPAGVEVYRGTGTINGTVPFRGLYTLFDPAKNPQLELDVAAGNNVLRTPQQFAALETEPVWVTINGGFFGGTASNSLTIKNGVVLYPNLKSLSRNSQTYYPTRAAFGFGPGANASAEWVYNVGTTNTPYRYPAPSPNNVTQAPQAQPTAGFPAGGNVWNAYTAIGAGPLLLKNGIRNITDTAELFDATSGVNPRGREPRTAIGVTPAGKYIMLVVDGRSAQSGGATMDDLADILQALGCNEAINLDGGGSSAMVVNNTLANVPSDAAGVRPVSSVLFIKQKNWIYDTEFADRYKETGGAWSETSNTGFFGPSRARFINSGDGSRKAYYLLKDLPPAKYTLAAWWVAASNRSNRTPFIIKRRGSIPDTVFVNQTTNGSTWNTLGSYQLSSGDTVEVSSNGQAGALVTTDAIQLVKTAGAAPQVSFGNGAVGEHVKDSVLRFNVLFRSVNTGVVFNKLRVTKVLPGGNRQLLDSIALAAADTVAYPLTQIASEAIGSVVQIVFEARDTLGNVYDTTYTYRVTPVTQIRLLNAQLPAAEKGKLLQIATVLETRSSTTRLRDLRVYRRSGNGNRVLADSLLNIGGDTRNYTYQETIADAVKTKLVYDFELLDSNGDTATRRVTTTVLPGRGNYRMVVISDLNSSYGDATYEWQVDSIMQRIPRLWQPDMVVAGGDLVAGQSNTAYDSAGNARMWTGFDQKIMKPLRDNNIPLAFTMGNHDAAAGFTVDRVGARNYWRAPGNFPNVHPVDTSNFPYYHSFMDKPNGDFFFVNWEASDASLSQADIDWTKAQFQRPEAQRAKYRVLIGHMPFYGVAQERDGAGNILNNGDALRKMAEDLGVTLYVSGHHHAYFPGKRGNIELLNAGAAGSGPRKWVFGDETAPNTVTLIDFFTASDSLVYTTYEIDTRDANDMQVFEESRLPKAVFGINGFTRNRFTPVSGNAAGSFSALHVADSVRSGATGQVSFTHTGNRVIVSGSFNNLAGKLLKTPDAIGVYTSVFPQTGNLLKALTVKTTNGIAGTFEGELIVDSRRELLELISVGAVYINIKTTAFNNGELRAQLYAAANEPLSPATINSQLADSVYQVRNSPAYFKISWNKATDKDKDAALYHYQLAADSAFTQPLFSRYTGTAAFLGLSQQQLWQLMDTLPAETAIKYWHRVIASDGKHLTVGNAQALRLLKTATPAAGNIEIEAPAYVYECAGKDGDGNCISAFANTASGHGAVVDKFGKVWYHPYSGGVSVKNPDGSFYQLTSPNIKFALASAPNTLLASWQPGAFLRQVTMGANSYTINLVTGIGTAADGNILVASSSALIKLDAVTGEPMRYVQLGSLGLSNPTTDSLGRIFVTRVLNNQSFLLKESTIRPQGFDTIRGEFALNPYPGTTRASAMAYDGKSVYLPSAGGNFVNRYVAADGINFVFDRRIDLQGTCNAIHVKPGNRVYILSNKAGNVPPILEYRNFADTTSVQSWSFPLTDIAAEAGDIRAVTLNEAADTFYAASLGSFKLYKYHIPAAGGGGIVKPANAPLYGIRQVKGVKAATGVADSLGIYCRLTGVVQTANDFAATNGYAFTLQDTTGGIQVFETMPLPYVPVVAGDTIMVRGFIRQAFGLTRLVPDTLVKLGSSKPLNLPVLVDSVTEKTESQTLQLHPLTLVTGTAWANSNAFWLNNLLVKNKHNDTLLLQVPGAGILNQPAPRGEIMAAGTGSQFAENVPYTTGYRLVLRDSTDIAYTNTTVNGNRFCTADSMLITVQRYGMFNSNNRFTVQVSNAAGSFTNPVYTLLIPADSLRVKIPAPAAGNGYRVRVVSSSPVLAGGDNDFAIEVMQGPQPVIVRAGNQLTASGAAAYQWYVNGQPVAPPQGQQAVLVITQPGIYQVAGTSGNCTGTSLPLLVDDPLPVTIVNITAALQNNAVLVQWQTALEKDMAFYEVEYSTGGQQFIAAARIPAAGGIANRYEWLHPGFTGGTRYYRVKATDKNGVVQYSATVLVNKPLHAQLLVYPNPVVNGTLQLQNTGFVPGLYVLRIYNAAGQMLHSSKLLWAVGSSNAHIPVRNLPPGKYQLVVQNEKDKFHTAFIIQ